MGYVQLTYTVIHTMLFSTGARTISTQTLKKIMIDIDPLMFEQTGEPKPLFPDHTQGEYRGYRGGRLVSLWPRAQKDCSLISKGIIRY